MLADAVMCKLRGRQQGHPVRLLMPRAPRFQCWSWTAGSALVVVPAGWCVRWCSTKAASRPRPPRRRGSAHEAFWAAARKTHGDTAGTRELIDVLLLHRHMAAADVIAGLTAALSIGASLADVVAVEARKHQTRHGVTESASFVTDDGGEPRQVVRLTERRLADPTAVIARLPPDARPLPSVARYDELLTRKPPPALDISKGNVS